MWDNRFLFEGQVVQATRLLQRMNAGFHARLTNSVCERHEQQEIFTLSDLRAYTLEEEIETEEHGDVFFKRRGILTTFFTKRCANHFGRRYFPT